MLVGCSAGLGGCSAMQSLEALGCRAGAMQWWRVILAWVRCGGVSPAAGLKPGVGRWCVVLDARYPRGTDSRWAGPHPNRVQGGSSVCQALRGLSRVLCCLFPLIPSCLHARCGQAVLLEAGLHCGFCLSSLGTVLLGAARPSRITSGAAGNPISPPQPCSSSQQKCTGEGWPASSLTLPAVIPGSPRASQIWEQDPGVLASSLSSHCSNPLNSTPLPGLGIEPGGLAPTSLLS